MAFNSLNLLIDVTDASKSGIYSSFDARLPASLPLFIRNDGVPVTLRFVQPSVTTSRPWDDVDLSSYAVALALGEFDVTPTSGTFILKAGPSSLCTTNSSTTVTVTGSTAGIVNGMNVSGPGILPNTTVTISGSTVTLSQAATASASGVLLFFYNPTSDLAYNISAADMATALNLLGPIIAAGGVTVQLLATGAYLISFVSAGVRTLIQSDATGLNPAASAPISQVVAGTTLNIEEQLLQLVVNPYALTESWTPLPAAAAIVTTVAVGSGSARNVQSIDLDPAPYDGNFQITTDLLTTGAIPSDATAAQVQTALNANGATYTVTGNASGPWTITAGVNGTKAAYTVNASNLLVPVGLSGVLKLNTLAMAQRFISALGAPNISLKFECQVTPGGGDPDTVLQLTSQVNKDVINFGNIAPSPLPAYYTAAQVNAAIAAAITALMLGTASTLNFDTDGALAADSDSRIATQKAVKTYIDGHSGGASPWVGKNADYNFAAGDRVFDTAGGITGFRLPAATGSGAEINIADGTGTWASNPSYMNVNGVDTINGSGVGSGVNLNVDWGSMRFIDVSAGNWQVKG